MAYALAVYRRGQIGDAVAAHGTTNALIALAVLLFGLVYVLNDFVRVSWLAAPGAYLQIGVVMLLALVGEAVTRSDGQRLNAGLAPRSRPNPHPSPPPTPRGGGREIKKTRSIDLNIHAYLWVFVYPCAYM
jgi:hypothetical protein